MTLQQILDDDDFDILAEDAGACRVERIGVRVIYRATYIDVRTSRPNPPLNGFSNGL
jgi:hypothetical protein